MPVVHKSKMNEKEGGLDSQLPVLDINQLHFSYPDGQKALKGISLTLNTREKVALVGPNGSGKSTLLLNIIGILRGEGGIQVGGIEVENGNLARLRANIGFVFQNPDDQLFSPTVYEDVAFGPLYMGLSEDIVQKKVEHALDLVHMSKYSPRLSHHLSEGEKKRIAIATVLSMEPEILLLDEPTLGLDPRSRRNLIHLLEELPQSMLVATHDLLMVRELFPRMIVLDNGTVVADGETQEILRNEELLERHGLEMP
jgi:cobalt/nickel transport system ATP-binding protein